MCTSTERPVTWSCEHVTTCCFGKESVKYLTTTQFLGAENAGSLGHAAIIFERQLWLPSDTQAKCWNDTSIKSSCTFSAINYPCVPTIRFYTQGSALN